MSLMHYNNEDFKLLIKEGIVLVDFYANWCGPCKMLAPILEAYNTRDDVVVIKVDVDSAEELARQYGIMSIPTLILFKNGVVTSVKQGFQTKEMLDKWIIENK
jgi:thioredoxin 1